MDFLLGLLIAYCRRFDVQTGSSSIYYISSTIGKICFFLLCCIILYGEKAKGFSNVRFALFMTFTRSVIEHVPNPKHKAIK